MPVIHNIGQQFPDWCEVASYKILDLHTDALPNLQDSARAEKLIVVRGSCTLALDEKQTLQAGESVDLDRLRATSKERQSEIQEAAPGTLAVYFAGRWQSPTGGSGVFTVQQSDRPIDHGDPIWYPKSTSFDRHFHDCDEYWVVIEGRGVAVSEGASYDVGPGDCIVTGMGHHHDFPQASETILAAFFETTLEGQQRRGHLWEHTHGAAEPQKERV